MVDELRCRLCGADDAAFYHADKKREYYRCAVCNLVFVPERFWLSALDEKAVYDLHRNSEDDPGYRRFLSRVSKPLVTRLKAGDVGLDFGCGPGPLLARMLREQGYSVTLFDPLYYNDPSLLENRYDFVCATEVAEHFKEPGKEFQTLFALLKPGGLLAIMTKRVLGQHEFKKWHYIRDLTHISFFSEETFEFLARMHDAVMTVHGSDVVLLQKGC